MGVAAFQLGTVVAMDRAEWQKLLGVNIIGFGLFESGAEWWTKEQWFMDASHTAVDEGNICKHNVSMIQDGGVGRRRGCGGCGKNLAASSGSCNVVAPIRFGFSAVRSRL